MKVLYRFFFAALLLLSWAGCKDPQQDPCASDYDQSALLQNVGENIIVPRYQNFSMRADELYIAANDFTTQSDAANLAALREAWRAAYLSWQRVAMLEFGAAEADGGLRAMLNSYPTFSDRIEQTITAGDTSSIDLNTPFYQYARGFAALDYLLYGVASDEAGTLTKYTSDPQAAMRRFYLMKVADHLRTHAQRVYTAWRADAGNYLLTFTTTTGVATGTSISLLVNQLSANFEEIKNNKLGTPLGAKVSYIAAPNKVEAFYSGISLDLALEAVAASRDLFAGKHEHGTTDGQGLDDYLNAVEAARDEAPATLLSADILAQLERCRTTLEDTRALGTLSQAITADINAVKPAYAAAVNQIVLLKTDLPSLLCVSITYSDMTDDGD